MVKDATDYTVARFENKYVDGKEVWCINSNKSNNAISLPGFDRYVYGKT